MVTTAGSAATSSTIVHLRRQGFRVVATDIDSSAPGLYLADSSHLIPPGGSPDFAGALAAVCAQEHADALIPLVDEELVAAAGLDRPGLRVLLPRPAFIRTCLDKYALTRRLAAAGLPVPATSLASEWDGTPEPPVVVKPRSGRGSRGVAVCRTAEELGGVITDSGYASEDLIVQELAPGQEYTVSVVVWRDGSVQAVVPKEVVLKRGVTKFAITRRHQRVADVCAAVQERLGADGPFNVQLALDEAGEPRIFEINPRFSSTAPLTVESGVDEVAGLVRQAVLDGPPLADEWREGVVMVRRWTDEFIDESTFASFSVAPERSVPMRECEPPVIAQVVR
ncbi:ATP-grasp domain-containing protein [Nocardiopsis coralliicola]